MNIEELLKEYHRTIQQTAEEQYNWALSIDEIEDFLRIIALANEKITTQ